MEIVFSDLIKLGMAILVGGLIGAEREYHNKAAGFRTLIFICVGSTLFTIFSAKVATTSDPARITAQIVSGVGFLGAGVIMRDSGRITGLTTAAMIWLVASLGMGIGIGQFEFVGISTFVILVILSLFPWFERQIDKLRDDRTYEVVCTANAEAIERLSQYVQGSNLKVRSHKQSKNQGEVTLIWHLTGAPRHHENMTHLFLTDPEVKQFHF